MANKKQIVKLEYINKHKLVQKYFKTGIRKNRANFSPKEKAKVTRLFNQIKHLLPAKIERKNPRTGKKETKVKDTHTFVLNSDPKLIKKMKKAGLKTTNIGYFLPNTLDNKTGKKIKGISTRVLASGIISRQGRDRAEYIYFFTDNERKQLTKIGGDYIQVIYKKILVENSTIRKMSSFRNPNLKLYYGNYSGHGDYDDLKALGRYIDNMSAEKRKFITGLKIIFIK